MELTNTTVSTVHDNFDISTSDKFVSIHIREIFQWVFFAVVSQIICVFGSLANIINIVCFVKQGFKESVNISLLGLAISDLGCLLALIWVNICYNPAFNKLDLPFEPIEVQYVTGAWPHVIFTRVSSWITAFITLERCLCIAIPLKVKILFTTKRVTIIIVCIFLVLTVNIIPVSYVNGLGWKFSPTRNKTLIGLVFTDDRQIIESIVFAVSNVFVQVSAFLVVAVCTVTLVVKLRIKSKWRKMSAAPGQADTSSSRDQNVTKMVIIIATLFIICFTPVCLIKLSMIVESELSIEGKYKNLFITVCSIGFALESTNSAMNIFVYYHMSSKFKSVFRQLFGRTSK